MELMERSIILIIMFRVESDTENGKKKKQQNNNIENKSF